jgi:1-acyl-sn-glycerol-3-phosphate acyltransferase
VAKLLAGDVMEGWPEHATRFWMDRTMPDFWPPRPSRFWGRILRRLRQLYARNEWMVAEVECLGLEEAFSRFHPHDGVILAPNHSHEGDAHVLLEAARRVRRRFYFMVAWQAFRRHRGLDGWILQRMGCFSVDREGSDRRALRQAIELLTTGNHIVIFPEGEIHHLNERLMPLLEGVAFIAAYAQKKLGQSASEQRVWVVPVGIRYRFVDDVSTRLEAAMKRLESRMFWMKPPPEAPLHERIIRYGEFLLTIKEKEKLGRSGESDGDLPTRIANLINALLARHEQEHLHVSACANTVPLRVKALRRRLLEMGTAENVDEATCRKALDALDDVQLALQLFSYPGDYIKEDPTPERMAETIEKFEEDVFGVIRSIGRRRATVRFGEPIDMKTESASGHDRTVVSKLTDRLEAAIGQLLSSKPARGGECEPRLPTGGDH